MSSAVRVMSAQQVDVNADGASEPGVRLKLTDGTTLDLAFGPNAVVPFLMAAVDLTAAVRVHSAAELKAAQATLDAAPKRFGGKTPQANPAPTHPRRRVR